MERYNDDPQPQFGGPDWNIGPGQVITPPKKRKRWPWVVGLVVLLMCGGGLALILAVGSAATKAVQTVEASGVPSMTPKATPKRSASPDIQEGTWIAGTDVKAGKYQTLGATDSMNPLCYWDVRTGSETGEIIAQGVKDKVSAKGYVTLKKGQYFTTSGCSDWTMVTSS